MAEREQGVKLVRELTSGPIYGCDHCGKHWVKPASILCLYNPDYWAQDARCAIFLCIPCGKSLANVLLKLVEDPV